LGCILINRLLCTREKPSCTVHSKLLIIVTCTRTDVHGACKYIMNKQALAEVVHEIVGGTKVQSEAVVESLLEAMIKTLKAGGEVNLAGFGKFTVKRRDARMARNPKTGETVQVAATNVPKFSAAKALKDAVK
jgi:nucleoid DNA-binding protein